MPFLEHHLVPVPLAPATGAPTAFAFDVPTGYGQGRATFGGLVLGALVAAMKTHLGDDSLRLRNVNAELIGSPAPGTCTITLTCLRASATMTTLQAQLEQGGQTLTHAVGMFGRARPLTTRLRPPPPAHLSVPDWRTVAPLPPDVPFAPEFARRFSYRPVEAQLFSQTLPAITSGWLWPRAHAATTDPTLAAITRRDEAFLVMLADVWWIAAFIALPAPRPAATISFALDVHDLFEGLAPDAPVFHRGELVALSDGYATETRELWGVDGRLLSLNRQTVAIVK